MTRIISFVALVGGVALLVAAPGWGKGQPLGTDPATEAQVLRGEALDRHYGIGRYLTDDGSKVDPSSEASPVAVTSSGSEVNWEQVGIVASIGLLLAIGLVAAMRFTRIRPLGH